ncbi:hypothetical protein [Chitinophaga tropicalis]|uniref:Uncharacterized protein n=1 Tax=Chitinophaga tropicalis TaxID=2683588 RepID=A0A7K1UAQ4_9BACT|nr:hypothetical protein [Chitinophaga tropicalis]MVT11340.1 hypothetical protein [Chitinophaga tropicalis]
MELKNIQQRLTILSATITAAQEEATKLMKELEQVSAPLPERGCKKTPLSKEQVSKVLANRLRSIKH